MSFSYFFPDDDGKNQSDQGECIMRLACSLIQIYIIEEPPEVLNGINVTDTSMPFLEQVSVGVRLTVVIVFLTSLLLI